MEYAKKLYNFFRDTCKNKKNKDYMAHKHKNNNEKIMWHDMNYEDKKNFIRDVVNAIYIKKIEGTTQQNYELEATKINFKTHNIKAYLDLTNKGIIDLLTGNNSLALINKEQDIDNYISRLRKKYKIKVDEIYIRWDEGKSKNKMKEMDDFFDRVVHNNDKLFKIIKVNRSNEKLKDRFYKERHIFISLDE